MKTKKMEDLKTWLTALDSGKTVQSVEMGGMGMGYEIAIQELAIETMRNLTDKEPPTDQEKFQKIAKAALDRAVKKLDGGYTGAQAGSAANIANVFWNLSPEKGIAKMRNREPDRVIDLQLIDGNLSIKFPNLKPA